MQRILTLPLLSAFFVLGLLGVIFLRVGAAHASPPPPDVACRGCHGDNDGELVLPSGEILSLGIDLAELDASPHSSVALTNPISCQACHAGRARYRYPHAENPAQTRDDFAAEIYRACQGCHFTHTPSHDEEQTDYTPPTYVGSLTCEACHEELYASFLGTGHPYILNKVVNGNPPTYPFSEVPAPPIGYSWDDILYVTGGYGWKARIIDKEGYLITGDEDASTQYDLHNSTLKMGDGWVPYHPGEQKPYDCGSCHTTGYVPEGHQDSLPGLIGTWAEDGIGCEACHGPGSDHADDPYQVDMQIDRESDLCGSCHRRGDVIEIDAQDGFIRHHAQYEELYESKKRVMRCVDCHDPHQTTKYAKGLGIKIECEECHFNEALDQKITDRRHAKCIDCHMPRVTKSALGDPERFSGDVRTHLVAINPRATSQFDKDERFSQPYLALDFACRGCHYPGGRGKVITDEQLAEFATGYHDRDQAGSANRGR